MKKSFRFLFAAVGLLGLVACADVPEIPYPLPDPNGGGDKPAGGLPFTSASLNDFTVQTIEGVDWSLGSSYAKATGYANGATTATKTWLVSPAINTTVTGDEGVSISFENVLRYVKPSTDLKGWHKVLASKDYTDDVSTATWTDLNFQPVESSTQTWDFYAATPVSLPDEFINVEKVYIAFYFQCDATNSTTWELKNFSIQEGTVTPTPPTPGPGGEGDGSANSPYNVAYVLSAGNPGTNAWVKGYIVGTVTDKSWADVAFGADNASNTNIIIADAADCKDANLCIPVQLPQGAVRDGLSLQQHPENLGKLVYLHGSLEKYFSQPGLKTVTEYSFEGGSGGGGGDDTGDAIFSADFTQGEKGFVAKDIELGSLSYVWQQSSSYGWKGSAYKAGNQKAESWLVSPTIDLTSATAPVLNFVHTGNYFDGVALTDYVGVYVLINYSGDVAAAEKSLLTIPNLPVGGTDESGKKNWDWVDSGDIALSSFVGKKINIAFRYTSTAEVAPTWEIKTMTVK